jgi:hypothetical protein
MPEPYGRITFMHMVLSFGGGLSLVPGDPKPVLLLVIVLKVLLDVKAHLRPRRQSPVSERRDTESPLATRH